MLFPSLDFSIYLPIVFLLYWFVFQKTVQRQNTFVLVASYVFYGWWDWRYLALIIASTLVDYGAGLSLGREQRQSARRWILWSALAFNLGMLGVFKY
jgi:D-alanyl-lipoteichoic acid acyltransferase DltB (MBOAT superfamily)